MTSQLARRWDNERSLPLFSITYSLGNHISLWVRHVSGGLGKLRPSDGALPRGYAAGASLDRHRVGMAEWDALSRGQRESFDDTSGSHLLALALTIMVRGGMDEEVRRRDPLIDHSRR